MDLAFPEFVERLPWRGGDLQTLRNYLLPRREKLAGYALERIELPLRDGSGDRLIASLSEPPARGLRPLVVLIHGLSGCERSPYVVNSAAALLAAGHPVLRLNLRGAGPSRPLCRLQYHAGRSTDLAEALQALPEALPRSCVAPGIVAMGYSLGANILLKMLGEWGAAAPVKAAVAISAPIDLAATARRMMSWRNWAYQRYLLADMKAESLAPAARLTAREKEAVAAARSVWEFDHSFVAPRNGFAGAEDYYARNAARRYLDAIRVPTLVIHAFDDPWIPPDAYQRYDWRRNPDLVPLLTRRGGHVGFHGPQRRAAWHDLCAIRFLEEAFPAPVSPP